MSHKALAVQESVSSHANTPLATHARGWQARFGALLAVLAMSLFQLVSAQAGANDSSFNPLDNGVFAGGIGGSGNNSVAAVAMQADGKVLIGGSFSSYNGTPRNNIARLLPDGSLDAAFDVGSGANFSVSAIAVQPDGRILVGGLFTTFNGSPRGNLVRLLSTGAVDPTFNTTVGANFSVSAIAIQSDGRVLIGGNFSSYNGTSVNCIVRLTQDGSLDPTFTPGTGPSNYIKTIKLQPDGRILVGGAFLQFSGSTRQYIARLQTNGVLDPTFAPAPGADDVVYSIALQADGKVLIGGHFSNVNNLAKNRLARLESNGALDASFSSGFTSFSGDVLAITLQSDGKIVIGGSFTEYGGVAKQRLARLTSTGSLDATFNPQGAGVGGGSILGFAWQPDGKLLIAGGLVTYNERVRYGLARLSPNGDLDIGFNQAYGTQAIVRSIACQPDNKILIAGSLSAVNDNLRKGVARLDSDGNVDPTFDSSAGADNNQVSCVLAQPDGRVLIGGSFLNYGGVPRSRIARLTASGALDTSFDPGTGANGIITAMAIQSDGKIWICGDFTIFRGVSITRIARLTADGNLDPLFNPGAGANAAINAIVLQPDGKAIIGGSFTSYNGATRNRVARINANGLQDTLFDPALGANNAVSALLLQADGRILVGGAFTTFNGQPHGGIVRLAAIGVLDPTFLAGAGANGSIMSLAQQPDGKILAGGLFTSFNNVPSVRVARLGVNGAVDAGFNSGTGFAGGPFGGPLYSLCLQADGKLLCGGAFGEYNGQVRNNMARLLGDDYFVEFCFGDGSAGTACPCVNIGLGDRGCNNSLSTGGGQLGGSGNPAADAVVLSASGLLPTALTIFLQGTTSLSAPAVFGDGVRCVGGALKRLYVKSASAGSVSAPAAGDPSIRAQSAALGDVIAPGTKRYYQAYYRDANASFCPAPAGSTYNITNGVEILWP
jgi:uncharacterized delta-60 repeat protein